MIIHPIQPGGYGTDGVIFQITLDFLLNICYNIIEEKEGEIKMSKTINGITMEQVEKELLWVGKYYSGGRRIDTYENLQSEADEFRDIDIVCAEGQPKHMRIIADLLDEMSLKHLGYTIYDLFNIYGKED